MSRTYRKLRIRNYGGMDTWGGNYYYGGRYFTQAQRNALRAGVPQSPQIVPQHKYVKEYYDETIVIDSRLVPKTESILVEDRHIPIYDWRLLDRLGRQTCYEGFHYDRVQRDYRWNERYFLEKTKAVQKWRWARVSNPDFNPAIHWTRREWLWSDEYSNWINIHEHVYRNRSVHRQRINGIRITKRNNSHVRRRQEQRDLERRLREYWVDED